MAPGARVMLAGLVGVATALSLGCSGVGDASTAGGGPAPTTLAPANGSLPEEFSNFSGLRELSDGRVLITESGAASRLLVADFGSGTVTPIGRKGHGPGEFDFGGPLLALGNDSTLMVASMGRWLILNGATIVSTTPPGDPVVTAVFVPLGVSRDGFILANAPWTGRHVDPESDSAAYALVSRATGASTPVATTAMSTEQGFPPPREQGQRPTFARRWQGVEMPFLFPDGWLAVARLGPYRVDWRSPDGVWHRGPALPADAVEVDETEKRAYMARLAERSGDPVKPTTTYQVWPREIPAFAYYDGGRLVGSPEGWLGIPRAVTSAHPEARYDFDGRDGRLVRRLVLARNERILTFGAHSVYVCVTDDDGFQHIQRHPWP